MNVAMALDIGGSHITAAAVNLESHAVITPSLSRRDVHQDAPAETLLHAWAEAAHSAYRQTPAAHFSHIGVAMPGPFDYAVGISRLQHKFAALYGRNVAAGLRAQWANTVLADLPVHFANDAAVWALGEEWGGAARGMARVIGITLGTGFGSGFIANGQIVTTGEQVPPGGELWNAPYREDIAENFVAGAAIQRAYAQRANQPLAVSDIALCAAAGDVAARAVFADMGQHLAQILQPWVQRFQPNGLVVGGNIARAWAYFHAPLEAGLPTVSCHCTTQFELSGLLGAAALGLV